MKTTLKKTLLISITLMTFCCLLRAQGPEVTSWLQNTTETGTYYVQGSSMLIDNNTLVNCQKVEYSDDFVYITATGVPAYPTGPFQDGNQSQAEDQSAIFKMPRNPVQNTGTPISTTGGNIGIFINGVALFDFRDGVGWDAETMSLCGGPRNPPCPGGRGQLTDWSRDAIPAEREGFDCAKGHPAMGNYHHHQNPTAFKLDLEVVSTVCNLYDADGLYALNESEHSPLIGFAYDGFPIYGAFAHKNANGTGGIVRMKSSYRLRNITERTTHADGTAVDQGPDVNDTYFLGYFREDYEFITPTEEDYLDEHNGRFCVTPEYPEGTYAYFATVDENWNSAYPYVVGPTFFGVSERRTVSTIDEVTTVYEPELTSIENTAADQLSVAIFPNPASDLIAVQLLGVANEVYRVTLYDNSGKQIQQTSILPGSTIGYFDVQTIYPGAYTILIKGSEWEFSEKIVIN